MKLAWIVIDQSAKARAKPYGRQYMIFETEEAMWAYVSKAGYRGERAAIMRDPGMVNFDYTTDGDIGLKFMRAEVR